LWRRGVLPAVELRATEIQQWLPGLHSGVRELVRESEAKLSRLENNGERTPNMRRISILGAVVVAAVMTSTALAAVNVKVEPTASFSGASVTLTAGNFSGLGSVPASATLTVTGLATYTCHNNGNPANVVPGQNPVQAQGGSSGPVDLGNADHNGRGTVAGITASVTFPPTPSAQAVGCGGKGSTNWTVVPNTLTATDAKLVITQGGSTIFCRTYTLGGSATGTPC
jgi:hypothetical protein